MRVISTELYFDTSIVRWTQNKEQKNPGVAVAWLRLVDEELPAGGLTGAEPSAMELKELLDPNFRRVIVKDPLEEFGRYADLWIQGVPSEEADKLRSADQVGDANYHITKFFLDSDIVYENSPPKAEKLYKLLKASPGAAVGTFLGYQIVAAGYEPLMLVTIPLGIIVIGSATGVARGLHNGLNKWVEGRFKPAKK